MKVNPRDLANKMREYLEYFDKHDRYDALEHQLFTEIATRQMEDEYYGKSKGLQTVAECMS